MIIFWSIMSFLGLFLLFKNTPNKEALSAAFAAIMLTVSVIFLILELTGILS